MAEWYYMSNSQRYGPVADKIYVTCNLTSAATLFVNGQGYSVGGGSSDVTVPLPVGTTPSFGLVRNGATSIGTMLER